MPLVVDFHLHSHFSRATSRQMDLPRIYRWAKIKGIDVIGTGDFTHPQWFAQLREQLIGSGHGLYTLCPDLAHQEDASLPTSVRNRPVHFILTAEISTIYTRAERTRKLHHLLLAPSLEIVSRLNSALSAIGNIRSDGRPILGLDSQDLLQLVVDTDPNLYLIPAHIWTPWFSLFGSRSGFNAIEEAFGNLTPHIFALETGLSSDPLMNWQLSALDSYTLISNSDAHSPSRIGREANIIDTPPDYLTLTNSLKTKQGFVGTIEFFPEEGKYHASGHRTCNVCLGPQDCQKLNFLCPRCGKPLVLGVAQRVGELADRPQGFIPPSPPSVEYLIPLDQIIANIKGIKSPNSASVTRLYHQLIAEFGSELDILRFLPSSELIQFGQPLLAQAIDRLRHGQVDIRPGYDGVYGQINIISPSSANASGQLCLQI